MFFLWLRHFRYVFVAYVDVFVSHVECCLASWLSRWFCLLRCSGSCHSYHVAVPRHGMLLAKAWPSMAKRQGHRSVSVRHVLQEFTRKLKRKPWKASKIAGTQKADSSWKSIKKWIPDTLETIGRFCRRVNPQLLQYIRSWQWRSQEKNDCVSHLSKALKAMYARWGTKKITSETPLGRCILTKFTKCRF